jgi:CubicO group peptidase (beta-lactamase class C family)
MQIREPREGHPQPRSVAAGSVATQRGFTLLGIVAERTMHEPYETLVRELVFTPWA